MVTLFDFQTVKYPLALAVNPTHVVAEAEKTPGGTAPTVYAVYLASETGFKNYCEGCPELALVQDTGNTGAFLIRVFCLSRKCVK